MRFRDRDHERGDADTKVDRAEGDVAERRTIFISGAANGIGRATAERFARGGYRVGIYDLDATAAELAAREIGHDARAGYLDVTEYESWRNALADFVSTSGDRLDVFVNNAGVMHAGAFADVSPAAHARTIDVNVKGVAFGAHAAYAYLRRTPGSRVVNLASASALYGQPDVALYSATKFAVRGLTEALQIEWRRDGISVASVWPLFVDTALVRDTERTATMDSLGIRLTATDVAMSIWKLATRDMARSRRAHRPVGAQTHLSMLAEKFAPTALTRLVVAKLSGR